MRKVVTPVVQFGEGWWRRIVTLFHFSDVFFVSKALERVQNQCLRQLSQPARFWQPNLDNTKFGKVAGAIQRGAGAKQRLSANLDLETLFDGFKTEK